MEQNNSKDSRRTAVIVVMSAALILVTVICMVVAAVSGAGSSVPLVCSEPVFPETIAASDGGTYVRKLSAYWAVWDVRNGRVIVSDINSGNKGGSYGVADFKGQVLVPCSNDEVHFTGNGYIAAHNGGDLCYFNMGGNCLEKSSVRSVDMVNKYEGEALQAETEYAEISDEIGGFVKYFGRYMIVSEKELDYCENDLGLNPKDRCNTCIYEYKAKKE